MNRVLVVGIDGGTWSVITPMLESGKLPRLESLIEKGARGTLVSVIPPFTTPAWNSMLSGLEPHKLGIYNFLHWKKGTYQKAPYFEVVPRHPDLFDALAQRGRKVISVNVPSVYQASDVPGIAIAGFLYPNREAIYQPSALRELVEECFGPYYVDMIDADPSTGRVTDKFSKYEDSLIELTRNRTRVTEYLMSNFEWNLTFVVFTSSDRLQHRLWSNPTAVERYFKTLDESLGRLLDACPDDTATLVVSDHGFGPQTETFCINDWLIREGYLVVHGERATSRHRVSDFILRSGLYKAKDLIPARLKAFLQEEIFGFTRIEEAQIEWAKTKAVGYSVCGEVFINRKGMFPKGIVSREASLHLIQEIASKLDAEIRSRTGEKPTILRKGEGLPEHPRFPDIVILPTDVVPAIDSSIGHSTLLYETEYGSHRPDGLVVLSEPRQQILGDLGHRSATDVAPTILDLLDVPSPWEMDGKSILAL